MAQTMNKEARRTTVRTYEGVQWFNHGSGRWVAAIPGTNLAVYRIGGARETTYDAFAVKVFPGVESHNWPIAFAMDLPWTHTFGTVKSISRDVQVLRAFVDGRSPHGVA